MTKTKPAQTKATLSQLAEQRFFEATGETWTGRGRQWFERAVDPRDNLERKKEFYETERKARQLYTGADVRPVLPTIEEIDFYESEEKARKLYTRLRAAILGLGTSAKTQSKLRYELRRVEKFLACGAMGGAMGGAIVAIHLRELAPLMVHVVATHLEGVDVRPGLPTIEQIDAKFEAQRLFVVLQGDHLRARLARVARGMPWAWARKPRVLACVSVLLGIRVAAGDKQRSRTPPAVLRVEEEAMRLVLKRAVP